MIIKSLFKKIILFLFIPVCLSAMETPEAIPLTSKLNEYINACVDVLKFNGTVLVAKDGEILVNRSCGMANFERAIPCTTQTRFILASVTKQFTAMAIMLLTQKGLLSVNDPLTKFIPDYPNGHKITIHNLLTHTSGIKDFESLPEWREDRQYHSASEIIKLFKDKSLDFEPGTQYKYSNSGYILLGYIVEQVSGQSLAQFMKENIFEPLNMRDTGFYYNAADERFAFGYTSGEKRTRYYDMSFAYGDGNLISTTQDLYLWSQALSSKKILNNDISDLLAQAFTPHVKEDENTEYGYGWEIAECCNHKLIAHNGGISGFSTSICRVVENDVCIIVLSNTDPIVSPIYKMSNDLVAIMFEQPYAVPQAKNVTTIDPVILDSYIGSYRVSKLMDMVISVTRETETDKFYAQITQASQAIDHTKFELYSESETKFFCGGGDMQISFVKDKHDKVTGFILHRLGEDFVGEKI